jgi:hypothetical protein
MGTAKQYPKVFRESMLILRPFLKTFGYFHAQEQPNWLWSAYRKPCLRLLTLATSRQTLDFAAHVF